jgi:hypothetical protein
MTRASITPPPVQLIGQDGLPAREEEAVLELTQRIAHALETLIRQHPTYWLWTYKRWKIRPDGEDPGRYPFYTRALRPGDFPAGREEEESFTRSTWVTSLRTHGPLNAPDGLDVESRGNHRIFWG